MDKLTFDQSCKTVKIGKSCPKCGKDEWTCFESPNHKRCVCGQKCWLTEDHGYAFSETQPDNVATEYSERGISRQGLDANENNYLKIMADIAAGKRVSPLKAIRAKCLDCTGYQTAEIQRCPVECPLKPFRMGKNTTAGGKGHKNLPVANETD